MAREPRWEKANSAGLAVGQLREPAGLSERLLNAILSISGCATLEEALEPLLDAALDVTQMDGGGVYWVEGDFAVLRHHRGLPEAFFREVMHVPIASTPVRTVLDQREPVEVAEISPSMREIFRRHGLIVHVCIRGEVDSDSEAVRSFLYRTAQEILFNTVKHAQVREATLRLRRVRDELWLTISDKGRGFDPASLAQTAGFGLSTIRERAELLGGRMKVKSAPGKGSTFCVAVPDVGA